LALNAEVAGVAAAAVVVVVVGAEVGADVVVVEVELPPVDANVKVAGDASGFSEVKICSPSLTPRLASVDAAVESSMIRSFGGYPNFTMRH
jgi:hypothetical protein